MENVGQLNPAGPQQEQEQQQQQYQQQPKQLQQQQPQQQPQQQQQQQPVAAAAVSLPGLGINGLVVQQALSAATAAAVGQQQGPMPVAEAPPRNSTSPVLPPIPKPAGPRSWPPGPLSPMAANTSVPLISSGGYGLEAGGDGAVPTNLPNSPNPAGAGGVAAAIGAGGAAAAAPPPLPAGVTTTAASQGGETAAAAAAAAATEATAEEAAAAEATAEAAAAAAAAAAAGLAGKRARAAAAAEANKRAREMQLRDFLISVEEYGSTIPGEATRFHLQRGGLTTSNSQIVTLMSLAADHLVASIVHESSLYRKLRLQRTGEQGREDANLGEGEEDGQMLTNEDLSLSLASRGINVSDSGLLVKRAGPAAISADAAANDAGSEEG